MQEENGKKRPVKIGLAPVQKEGIEYEFDVLAEMTPENTMIISKTRCPELNGQIFNKPGKEVADILNKWLNDGLDPVKPAEREQINETVAAQAAAPAANPSSKTAPLTLQTAAPKQAAPAKEAAPEQAAENIFPEKGVFEHTGVLAHIENKGTNGANKWELFLKDVKTGLVTFSQAMNVQAVALLGKAVRIKAVVNNPGQYVLLQISPAN